MKIKNILHAAALRFCLLAAAAIAVIAATAAYTASTPSDSSGSVESNLVAVTIPFEFNADNVSRLVANSYYENNTWYKYGSKEASQTSKKSIKCIEWKLNDGIVFKISEPGKYKVKISYFSENTAAGVWVYQGANHLTSFDSETAQYKHTGTTKVNDSFEVIEVPFDIIVTNNDECWQVSGTDSKTSAYLHSINVTKIDDTTEPDPEPEPLSTVFPSSFAAINSNTFWYHNGGPGLYTPGGATPVYKYLVANADAHAKDSNVAYAPTTDNMITINGDGTYKSYEIKPGDAIGFKLAPYYKSDNTYDEYRIKLYYYSEGEEAVLHTGNDAINTYQPVYPETTITIRDSGGDDTGTRMKTYHVSPYENTVYWVKNNNTDGQSLYLGGFEILKKNNGSPTGEFKGSWYVEDQAADLKISNDNGKVVGSIAQSHDGVVMGGITMPLNKYEAITGKKSVMFNYGSYIGVNIPAGATLSFNYTADAKGDGITIVGKTLSDDTNATSDYNKFSGYTGTVSYTNDTGTAETVRLQGMSANYAYFSGFEVTGGEVDPTPSIDNATPIEEDYVWYPVDGQKLFGNETFSDADENGKTVFVYKDFYPYDKDKTLIYTTLHNKSGYKLHGKDMVGYRVSKNNTQIGFKIAAGKKGVINCYYPANGNVDYFTLHQSNNPTSVGDALSRNTGSMGDNVNYTQYQFDTSGGVKTFWLKAGSDNVWFGGFEVLFDDDNETAKSVDLNTTYSVAGTETITNALGTDDEYVKGPYSALKSESTAPVAGASMLLCPSIAENAVMVYERSGVRNAILVKVPTATKYLNVKGYLANGANIKVYKGTASAPDTSNDGIPVTGSDTNVLLSDLGAVTTDAVYWITSDDAAGAYVTSVTPLDGVFTTLQPINSNYIYKVNGVPAVGVQNTGDCNGRIKFVDENGSAKTNGNPTMNVIGTDVTPVTIENGTDFFGIKVDNGPGGVTTGYIKVYFNGGNAGNHVLQELPLSDPMYAGWNSTYNQDTHIITFNGGKDSSGRGWWLGDKGRDLSAYNKLNIEATTTDANTNMLQVVVQSANGARAVIPYDAVNKRFLGDLTNTDLWDPEGDATFDIEHVTQIYIQDTTTADEYTSHVEIKSARLMNKPIVIAKGTDENSKAGYTELFGGKIYNLDNNKSAFVYEYPFDLSKPGVTAPQLTWITGAGSGTINIAAIEVIYDTRHAKVVDWYVNKDTKMIVGSDDPQFTMSFNGETLKYPSDYDEYVTFYMSSGRQANVSFIMPEAVREEYDWEKAVTKAGSLVVNVKDSKNKDTGYVDEVETDKNITDNKDKLAYSYGKHTIFIDGDKDGHTGVDKVGIGSGDKISFQAPNTQTYNRHNGISADRKKINNKGDLYKWYTYSYDLPSNITASNYTNKNFCAGVSITATQKEAGSSATETVGGKTGEWKIYMRFVSFKAPVATAVTSGDKTTGVTVTAGQSGSIYYTIDSSEPDNLGKDGFDASHSSTNTYSSEVDVNDKNCIFKAAQYITTDFLFYDDISKGKDESAKDNVLKVVSSDLAVTNDISSVVYVKNTSLVDDQIFNVQEGGYMLTIPTGTPGWQGDEYKDKDGNGKTEEVTENNTKVNKTVHYYDQPFTSTPFLYLTLGGKNWPFYNGSPFDVCGTNWIASNDGGLHTYLDSYQNKMDVDGAVYPDWWKERTVDEDGNYVKDESGNWVLAKVSGTQNQNPYTECNGGVGGIDTEDGGMFLQPIAGTMLRFEPEYDGVITVWLRQNGCLDNNTQELGTFNRRPVYVMDENGRIMRRSTIRPTADHYMGINGVWAINSSVCEQRSQVEHTWLYEVAQQAFANHPLYASRFNDDVFPNRWVEDNLDHSGHILYGWWYKGFDLDATRSSITSASHVSRYNYMEPELLYRSDGIFNMELNRLGLKNAFAKYGFELPNFQYVRYRIPVKAGKTYYIAGRGTKNGFSAIRFDALKPNTNTDNNALYGLRYTDNPAVVENSNDQSDDYLKVTSNWDNNGERQDSWGRHENDLTGKSEADVLNAYSSLTKIVINDNDQDNAAKINGVSYNGGKDYSNGNLVGQTVDVELNRTFRAYNWHPIILPFSLSETRVEQYFGVGTKILYLDPYVHTMNNQLDEVTGKSYVSAYSQALEGTKLSFTLHRYQMLYANTPAFICPTFEWPTDDKTDLATNEVKKNLTMSGTGVTKITFKRVTIDGSNSRNFRSGDNHSGYIGYPISNDYEIVGSYDSSTQRGDIYFVNNKTPDGGLNGNEAELVHYNGNGNGVTMKGTRVWIRPRSGAVNAAPIMTVGSRGFSDFEEDSELTGISDIVADDYTIEGYDIEDDGVYDLLGRKVGQGSLDGLLKGIYIFHGRKVYVK